MASEKPNSNDVNADARLEFVKRTLIDAFDFEVHEITPIAYEEGFPFPYNNFVYGVKVDRPESCRTATRLKQPGTQAIPPDESSFIFRMPNPVSGYNDIARVENEVACLSLAREALQPSLSHLVPRVYGWATATGGQGWILQQRMPGVGLSDRFSSFSAEEKSNVLSQMADILACFQRFRLPQTIDQYGGVGFDQFGGYISTALSTVGAGPFSTYQDLLRATITTKLHEADDNARVRGWRDRSIRRRLDEYLTNGLSALLHDMPSLERVLVHADLSIDNVLYDDSSKKLAALLDFDFAHIGSVADEFFRSLGHGIGRFPSIRDNDAQMTRLHQAMLHGFPQPLPPNSEESDWTSAKAWDDALKARDMQRPATIPHMEVLADIYWLSSQILPFKLCNEIVVGNSTEEQLRRRKEEGEALLDSFLTDFGY